MSIDSDIIEIYRREVVGGESLSDEQIQKVVDDVSKEFTGDNFDNVLFDRLIIEELQLLVE